MSEHAPLSPSAAERWLVCPASVELSAEVGQAGPGSSYAHEGTAAHKLAELKVRGASTKAWAKEHPEFAEDSEMLEHAEAYGEFIRRRVGEGARLLLEQRVHSGIPGCWGTADALILARDHVEVVDFKYGQGVLVSVHDNPQLKLYALGGLEIAEVLWGAPDKVYVTVVQPRRNNTVTEELSVKELQEWRNSIQPVAAEALEPGAHFRPTETGCRWCPAKGSCKAQAESVVGRDFGEPDTLSPEEIAEALDELPRIRDWINALEETALYTAIRIADVPNYKVVMSGGKRVITDQEVASNKLTRAGYSTDDFLVTKMRGLGELEKLVGKTSLPGILGGTLYKTEGRPALVPGTDNRPAIRSRAELEKEFGE